ncbi:MAG TPA: thioredoxin [Polyangiaceae bacterium]|nr:thioredoxin [Polyangiaceae bacterium]
MAKADRVRELSDETFDAEVLGAPSPVLVDFTASWCGPCKQLAPLVDEVAGEFDGQIVVGKLDVDENPATARRYEVRAMPTLMVFIDGEPRARHVGLLNRKRLLDFLLGALDDEGEGEADGE